MANTIPSEGTTLSFSEDGQDFTEVAEIVSCGIPGGTVPVVSKTKLTSNYQEKRPGLIPDLGQIAFRLQFDPNENVHQELRSFFLGSSILHWKIEYNDGFDVPASDTFMGFMVEWAFDDAEDESNIEADVTIEITGGVSSSAGSN